MEGSGSTPDDRSVDANPNPRPGCRPTVADSGPTEDGGGRGSGVQRGGAVYRPFQQSLASPFSHVSAYRSSSSSVAQSPEGGTPPNNAQCMGPYKKFHHSSLSVPGVNKFRAIQKNPQFFWESTVQGPSAQWHLPPPLLYPKKGGGGAVNPALKHTEFSCIFQIYFAPQCRFLYILVPGLDCGGGTGRPIGSELWLSPDFVS